MSEKGPHPYSTPSRGAHSTTEGPFPGDTWLSPESVCHRIPLYRWIPGVITLLSSFLYSVTLQIFLWILVLDTAEGRAPVSTGLVLALIVGWCIFDMIFICKLFLWILASCFKNKHKSDFLIYIDFIFSDSIVKLTSWYTVWFTKC